MVRDFFRVFEGTTANAVVMNAIGWLVSHSNFVGLAGDLVAQGFEAGAAGGNFGNGLRGGESGGKFFRDEAVACLVEMKSILSERLGVVGEGLLADFKEIDEFDVHGGGDCLHGLGVDFDFGISFGGVGELSGFILLDGSGGNEEKFSLGMASAHEVNVETEVLFEFHEAVIRSEGLVHAEAHHDSVGGILAFEVGEMLTEFGGANAEANFITGVGEGAVLNSFAGLGGLQKSFKGAVFLQTFDEAVAVEESDSVSGDFRNSHGVFGARLFLFRRGFSRGCFGGSLLVEAERHDGGGCTGDLLAGGPEDTVHHHTHGVGISEVSRVTE